MSNPKAVVADCVEDMPLDLAGMVAEYAAWGDWILLAPTSLRCHVYYPTTMAVVPKWMGVQIDILHTEETKLVVHNNSAVTVHIMPRPCLGHECHWYFEARKTASLTSTPLPPGAFWHSPLMPSGRWIMREEDAPVHEVVWIRRFD